MGPEITIQKVQKLAFFLGERIESAPNCCQAGKVRIGQLDADD
jgi:hypothetical protein